MPFISTSHKRVTLVVFTPCAVCTERRINHCANCAMAWPHGAPVARASLPVWMHFGAGAGVRYYASITPCYATCFAEFIVHDEKMYWMRHLQFIMIWQNVSVLYGARAANEVWHGASHQHSPVMYAGLLLFGGKCSGGKIFPSRRRHVSGNISTYQIHKYATK